MFIIHLIQKRLLKKSLRKKHICLDDEELSKRFFEELRKYKYNLDIELKEIDNFTNNKMILRENINNN